MGLDMYLTGERYFTKRRESTDAMHPSRKAELYDLGYWRKHPNLHGYIVQELADGIDDCREIHLDEEHVLQIIQAITARELPETTGFFFGVSDGSAEEIQSDLAILQAALDWVRAKDEDAWRSLSYRASW